MPEAAYAILALLLGLGLGAGACALLLRKQDAHNLAHAETRAREVLAQAERNAENILKEAELKAKDELFRKREEFNRETETTRTEQRDQERRLEKREDLLEQKH